MEVIRTPDDRFAGLPDFPFSPHYVEVPSGNDGTLRVHYLDEGPRDAPVVLLMHGEPSWCFLYRKMIPVLTAAGLRVRRARPGRLRPLRQADGAHRLHVRARTSSGCASALFDALDLRDVTLVCQDWGGLVGLRLVGEHPDRFARVVAANTFLPTGDTPPGDAFLAWQRFSQTVDDFPVGFIVNSGCTTDLADEVVAAYDAPFPDEQYKAGARQFPMLVPTSPDDPAAAANRAAWEVLRKFDKPFLTAFSDEDPITRGGDRVFQRDVPGCAGQPHTTITGGGHFLQEDRGEELAQVVAAFVKS